MVCFTYCLMFWGVIGVCFANYESEKPMCHYFDLYLNVYGWKLWTCFIKSRHSLKSPQRPTRAQVENTRPGWLQNREVWSWDTITIIVWCNFACPYLFKSRSVDLGPQHTIFREMVSHDATCPTRAKSIWEVMLATISIFMSGHKMKFSQKVKFNQKTFEKCFNCAEKQKKW